MTEPATETAPTATVSDSAAQEPGQAGAATAEPDHKGLLGELAGRIRDIPLPGRNKHVTDLLAFLADHHL